MASRFDILSGKVADLQVDFGKGIMRTVMSDGTTFVGLTSQQTDLVVNEAVKNFLHRHPAEERQLGLIGHVVVDESDWNDARRICQSILQHLLTDSPSGDT